MLAWWVTLSLTISVASLGAFLPFGVGVALATSAPLVWDALDMDGTWPTARQAGVAVLLVFWGTFTSNFTAGWVSMPDVERVSARVVWTYLMTLPVVLVETSSWGYTAGWAIALVGLATEVWSAYIGAGEEPPYARQPCLFGRAVFVLGVYLVSSSNLLVIAAAVGSIWSGLVFAPTIGLLSRERRLWSMHMHSLAYLTYRSQTSPLVPMPPSLWALLAPGIKRWLCFEWRAYREPPRELMSISSSS